MPSSRNSGSIAANRAIAASCAADATSITRCNDPTTAAHCSSDPATVVVANAPDSSTSAAPHAACTSTGPLAIPVTPLRFRYVDPTDDHRQTLRSSRPHIRRIRLHRNETQES